MYVTLSLILREYNCIIRAYGANNAKITILYFLPSIMSIPNGISFYLELHVSTSSYGGRQNKVYLGERLGAVKGCEIAYFDYASKLALPRCYSHRFKISGIFNLAQSA